MKTYKVIGSRFENQEALGPVKDANGAKWDPGSHVTERQVPDDLAAQLLAEGAIELLPAAE